MSVGEGVGEGVGLVKEVRVGEGVGVERRKGERKGKDGVS